MKWIAGVDWTRLLVGWFLFVTLTGYQVAANIFSLPGAATSADDAAPQWLLPAEVIVAIGWSVLLLALLPGHMARGRQMHRRPPRM